ncbi:MAG: PEGA domain-containing protein [Terriglobia bacterium]
MAVVSICALVLIVGAGSLAHHAYRMHVLKERLGDAIGRDLGLTETILSIHSESSKITFGEIFELCNKSVETRTNLIVELRGLYPELDYRLKTRLIEYLSAENEFVRAMRDYYREEMQFSTAMDSYTEGLKDTPSSEYGWDFYHDRVRQLKAKTLESAREAEKSADEFLATYDKMTKEETAIAQEARNAGLRFEPIFQKYAQGNQKSAQGTKQVAQQFEAQEEAARQTAAKIEAAREAPREGNVAVISWPQGASVSVDGEGVGGLTPLTIPIEAGSHRIEIVKLGYQMREVHVLIKRGKTANVEVTLIEEQK